MREGGATQVWGGKCDRSSLTGQPTIASGSSGSLAVLAGFVSQSPRTESNELLLQCTAKTLKCLQIIVGKG